MERNYTHIQVVAVALLSCTAAEFLHGKEYLRAICTNQTWPCLTVTSQQRGEWHGLVTCCSQQLKQTLDLLLTHEHAS